MTSLQPHFLLVGNDPFRNRGCEAIVRGTMTILRRMFGEAFCVTAASFGDPAIIAHQAAEEKDPLIQHISLQGQGLPLFRWSRRWWQYQMVKPFTRRVNYASLKCPARTACCALQIGGDNYSLDYGKPMRHMRIDDDLRAAGVPVVLWGASVGPFDADPQFEPVMIEHLRRISAIVVRESRSLDYLRRSGVVDNVTTMADPAFVMEPVPVTSGCLGVELRQGTIGINLSPWMAQYVCGGDLAAWTDRATSLVKAVGQATNRPILLVPHVTQDNTNDHAFLRQVMLRLSAGSGPPVECLDDRFSAAETKWIIAQCAAFVGARTHATIAAISSMVPTLSLAYSVKAIGLNQDIFGSLDYCILPDALTPALLVDRVTRLLHNAEQVKSGLVALVPQLRETAFGAGNVLRKFVHH